MRNPTAIIARVAAVVLVAAFVGGCKLTRELKITEVQPHAVELYLAEPRENALDLTNMRLRWVVKDAATPPVRGQVDLGPAGSLEGGQYLVVYEDPHHTGGPVAAPFRPWIPGIKVRPGFFPRYDGTPAVSMSVEGKHSRAGGRDEVSDVVRFGPMPRPKLGGEFKQDGSLAAARPEGNRSISRDFDAEGPVDTDSEADWSVQFETTGAPSP